MLRYSKKLQDRIIELLAQSPYLTPLQVHSRVQSTEASYSIRAVYKEVHNLIKEGIVVRLGGALGISLPWLTELSAFVDTAQERYTSPETLKRLLPTRDAPLKISFSDLNALDTFCSQLMSTLHFEYPSKAMFAWHPRQWFHMVRNEAESRLKHSVATAQYKRYIIVGGDSYLDQLFLRNLPANYVASTAKGPFHGERDTYYGVIADTILTVKLGKQSAETIDALYERVKSRHDFTDAALITFVRSKIRSRVSVELDPKRAASLKRKFCDYFGISKNSSEI